MAIFKVNATHMVDAMDWEEAERKVESNQSLPIEIVSQPAVNSATEYVNFGLAWRIKAEHAKIYFEAQDDLDYSLKLEELTKKTQQWLNNLLINIYRSNEGQWS